MIRLGYALVPVVLGASLFAGCGGGDSGNSPDSGPPGVTGPITPTSGPYQPLAVGATWTYHVDDQGVVYDKQSTVEAQEDVGGAKAGVTAFRVRENIKDATQLTWYSVNGTEVVRHRDQMIDMTGALAQ